MSQSRATRPQCRSVAAVTFFARSPAKSGESRNCVWFVRSRTTEGTSGEFSQGCAHVRRASSGVAEHGGSFVSMVSMRRDAASPIST